MGPASRFYTAYPDDYAVDHEIHTETWEWVNLPHDYVIDGTPEQKNNNALGYLNYDNAWYRKKFMLSEDDKDKRITLFFEGIASCATIYLNGCILKRNYCGYNSFEINITDFVKFDEENVLAVYVQTEEHEGWWYEGGGIYHHVWLVKTDNTAIDLWGVYAAPKKIDDKNWRVKFETTVLNDSYDNVDVEIVSDIIRDGQAVAKAYGKISIPSREKATAAYEVCVENPEIWDIDTPNLYDVKTIIKKNNAACDENNTRIGFRKFVVDSDKGLFLNGKHIKINGVCAHIDCGLLGKAVPDNIHRYKVEMIKEMGANGYRTSHYPHTEAIMDALDEMGFIVMDETRWFSSSEDSLEQLEMLIKRDRNRPSVLFWSIGNEEPHHTTEEGRRICKSMMSVIRKLDNTRLITSAVSHNPDVATVYDDLDALGINYNFDKYDSIRKKYPNKPIFSSECCATGSTRGWYCPDSVENGYISAYDKDTNFWFRGRQNTWKFLSEHNWILGGYQWTAFEHRGETVWPRLSSQSGAIDLFLQKKDAFCQNKSLWSEKPMVHLLPHWNFEGLEGEKIKVVAYTNCEELELFQTEKVWEKRG